MVFDWKFGLVEWCLIRKTVMREGSASPTETALRTERSTTTTGTGFAVSQSNDHIGQKVRVAVRSDAESCRSFRDEEKHNCIVGTVGGKRRFWRHVQWLTWRVTIHGSWGSAGRRGGWNTTDQPDEEKISSYSIEDGPRNHVWELGRSDHLERRNH